MIARLLLNLLGLGLVLGFAALGRWQLGREEEKRAQLAAAEVALAAAPAPLAQALAASDAATAIRRVAGDGEFVRMPPLWLDNQRRGSRVGMRLYCVAVPAPGGSAVLVDLGWLPVAGDRQLPAGDCPRGRHALAGLLTPPPAVGLALGPGIVAQPDGSWLATRIEPPALRELLGPSLADAAPRTSDLVPLLSGAVLRLDPAVPLGFERDLELLANTLPPEKHRGYAVQWFGLAAAMMAIVLVLNFRRKPSP